MSKFHWIAIALAVVTACVFSPKVCQAEAQCPWLNAATAGGFLGGEVRGTVSAVTVEGDATCEFVRTEGATSSMLRIAIHTMAHPSQEYSTYLGQCNGLKISLRGIGNEAVRCVVSGTAGRDEERIIGRVRDRAFLITIQADWIKSPPTSATKTRNPMSDDSENVAEQVAGSMF